MAAHSLQIGRTTSLDPDFRTLAAELEGELRIRDGDEHENYAQMNRVGDMKHVLVCYAGDEPVACGALRELDGSSVELKRMYVRSAWRNKGIGTAVLVALEEWSRELGFVLCILETGKNQPEALAFYQKNHYRYIPAFAPYQDSENSVCFQKGI
jgi:GNAT superfamily N-acetyltransferase